MTPSAPGHTTSNTQLSGWRLQVTILASFVGFFLSLLDTTVVAVSLPTIADHFDEFDRSTWVINSYLITYMAFAIITSRLSDIFSRKAVEISSFILFIAFSLACALSRSMTQLIVFRAIQGVGGSGLYSMCMVMSFTLIPFEKRGMISACVAVCVVSAGILGPILGGVITQSRTSDTWPWIFWINLPVASIALFGLMIAWPSDKSTRLFTPAAFAKIDFLGALLLLAASVLLVFALQEGGVHQYAWNSATIIASFAVSGACFVCFASWQWWIAFRSSAPHKVVFPINLLAKRVIVGALCSMLFTGYTYYIAVVNIPQRFQIVSGNSPVMAGVRLLPMMGASAVGSVLGGALSSKRNNTAYCLVVAGAFQVLGYGLMTTLGNTRNVPASQYGFQVFLGLGFGIGISSVTRMMELQAEPQWLAVTQGALAQVRSLGGSLGLASAVIVLNARVKGSSELRASLTESQETSLLRSPLVIETFSTSQQSLVSGVFAEAFTQQMRVATYIAVASFLSSLLTLERNPPNLDAGEKARRAALAQREAAIAADTSCKSAIEERCSRSDDRV